MSRGRSELVYIHSMFDYLALIMCATFVCVLQVLIKLNIRNQTYDELWTGALKNNLFKLLTGVTPDLLCGACGELS